jgi:hypothetical protein
LNISQIRRIFTRDEFDISGGQECSKKSVQQGRSPFDARSVHGVREHGKMARTPLAAFFNIPGNDAHIRPLFLTGDHQEQCLRI